MSVAGVHKLWNFFLTSLRAVRAAACERAAYLIPDGARNIAGEGRLYAISGTGNIRIFFVESVRLHQNFMYLCYMLCSLSAIAG